MNNSQKEHPVGVSGLMRVRNEEEYVEASIDSVIDVLDELIICYQECTDRTPEILERKRKEYPRKIKLYYYAPKVYAHDLTPDEYAYAYSLPDDSPHLLSSYYNYTLSKATYRYAVKIDADQIYFTDRMREICDAYRSDKKMRLTVREWLTLRCYFNHNGGWKSIIKKGVLSLFGWTGSIGEYYRKGVLKQIVNRKIILWISGINLYKQGDAYWAYCDKKHNFYNGIGDLCFFEITADTLYAPFREYKENNTWYQEEIYLIEKFIFDRKVESRQYGFCWYHMRCCKKENLLSFEFPGVSISALKKKPYKWLKNSRYMENQYLPCFLFFHQYDQTYPLPEEAGIGNISVTNK